MRVFLLSVVVVLFLITGGIASMAIGWLPDLVGVRDMLGLNTSVSTSTEAAGPAAPPRNDKERLGPPPFLLSLKSISVPVIVDGRLVKTVFLDFRVVIDPADREIISRKGHVLSAVFLQDLIVSLPQQLEVRDTFDMEEIKERMKTVANEALRPGNGREIVREVILQRYHER